MCMMYLEHNPLDSSLWLPKKELTEFVKTAKITMPDRRAIFVAKGLNFDKPDQRNGVRGYYYLSSRANKKQKVSTKSE